MQASPWERPANKRIEQTSFARSSPLDVGPHHEFILAQGRKGESAQRFARFHPMPPAVKIQARALNRWTENKSTREADNGR